MGEGNLEKAKEYASKLLKLTVVTGAVGGLVVLGITPFVLKFASLNETAMHYLKYMLLINTYYIMGLRGAAWIYCSVCLQASCPCGLFPVVYR